MRYVISSAIGDGRERISFRDMKLTAQQLLEYAMKLSDEERAALAGLLIDSLDSEVDPDAEQAWSAEIKRRIDAIDRGETQLLSWSEARARIVGKRA